MRTSIILMILWALSIGSILIAPFFGLSVINPIDIIENYLDFIADPNVQLNIAFWDMRLPRVLCAWIIGAVLALSGMCFQAILKNPLAEPFTLGIASGSALGASIYIHMGITFNFLLFSGVAFYAFLGALAITFLVYYVNKGHLNDSVRILLMGVILSFFCASIIMLMQAIGRPHDSLEVMQWMMGRITQVGWVELKPLALVTFIGCSVIVLYTPHLNLMNTGQVTAMTRGINPTHTIGVLYFVISLMLGSVIAVSGPIGFVGLIVPHIVRKLMGHDHRILWMGVIALGGALLVLSDLVSRWVVAPSELPVGVITSLLGAPFFLWILLGGKKK